MKRLLVILLLLAACAPPVAAPAPMTQPAALSTETPAPTATVRPTRTPAPTLTQPMPTETTAVAAETPLPTFAVTQTSALYGGVRVTETRLGSAAVFSLQEGDAKNDEFYSRIPPEIMTWPEGFKENSNQETPEPLDRVLERFGYRLDGTTSPYTLLQGERVLSQNVTYTRNYAFNRSKTDFFALLTLDNYQVWLLQKDRFELYFEGKPRVPPIFLGDRLLMVDYLATDEGFFAVVKAGDRVIYTSPRTALGPETCPVDFFRAWQDHWVMQIDGQVVVDGRPLGKESGYQKAFDWFLIQGKPVYLFQKGGQYGISYAGQALAPKYDQIVQARCVVGAMTYPFAAWGVDGKIRFFAQRGGDWFVVEVEGERGS